MVAWRSTPGLDLTGSRPCPWFCLRVTSVLCFFWTKLESLRRHTDDSDLMSQHNSGCNQSGRAKVAPHSFGKVDKCQSMHRAPLGVAVATRRHQSSRNRHLQAEHRKRHANTVAYREDGKAKRRTGGRHVERHLLRDGTSAALVLEQLQQDFSVTPKDAGTKWRGCSGRHCRPP